MNHNLKNKLLRLKNATIISLAVFRIRLFGTYKNNIWDGEIEYSKWEHKGKVFYLPTLEDCKNERPPDGKLFDIRIPPQSKRQRKTYGTYIPEIDPNPTLHAADNFFPQDIPEEPTP